MLQKSNLHAMYSCILMFKSLYLHHLTGLSSCVIHAICPSLSLQAHTSVQQ